MIQHSIKGLLFDKDGTLFDYQTTWGPWAENFISEVSDGDVKIAHQIATTLGFNQDKGRFLPTSKFIAGTTEEVLEVVLSAIPSMSINTLEKIYFDSTAKATLSPPVPLKPLLHQFKRNKIKIGVATNDHETTAINHLSRANIKEDFDFIVGYDSGFGSKPEPGMLNAFCNTTGLKSHEIAMVGDTLHDLEAGQRANMLTIGVLTGMATREELETKATVVLNHIGEIPKTFNLI